jgi:hypothetical protein
VAEHIGVLHRRQVSVRGFESRRPLADLIVSVRPERLSAFYFICGFHIAFRTHSSVGRARDS